MLIENYYIQGSNDNSNWTKIYTGSGCGTIIKDNLTFATSYRYYKATIEGNPDGGSPSIGINVAYIKN